MNNSKEERLKIAVFVDFDNIAIGVKQSLGRNFDVGTVLEAIKEKGQVVTKIAYGDWKRNEDFSRAMTQHAVQMVQRNLTPGGDKNGADIALALDALEMAFTRDHINAFVIVGGDSDFIALVEKLKQYDKTVFVVGGRAFTSVILQKNCHEFISYENLIGVQTGGKRSSGRQQMISSPAPLETALPLIRRSLKILSDREVSPQLGLLKSTLLQLDSTFSERDYGVSSFRDFTQKLADAGYVHLKQVDRSILVELKEIPEPEQKPVQDAVAPAGIQVLSRNGPSTEASTSAGQPSDATRALKELIRESKTKPHWPMYLRSFKQFLRSLPGQFDEHQFGITSTYDLVRQAQKDGLLNVERNRQGILRIYPGELFPKTEESPDTEELKAGREPEQEAVRATTDISEEFAIAGEAAGTETAEPAKAAEETKTEQKPKRRGRKAAAKQGKKTAGDKVIAGKEPGASKKKEAGSEDVVKPVEDVSGKTSAEAASPSVGSAEAAADEATESGVEKKAATRKRKTAGGTASSGTRATAKKPRTRKTTSRKTTSGKKSKAEEAPEKAIKDAEE